MFEKSKGNNTVHLEVHSIFPLYHRVKFAFRILMSNKKFWACFILLIFTALIVYSNAPTARAEIQVSNLGTFGFVGNDVDSKGVLWAGDKNFSLWKSVDNGVTFQFVYRMPGTFESNNSYSGIVWNVFVDSRDCIFTSAGGTGALFRSTNGGASFSQVLKTNGTSNESFYISMTEDDIGTLYTVTYTSGKAQPLMLKSTDGGSSWIKMGAFAIMHFHTVKFNPANGYLYVITGEGNGFDSAKIFRSQDRGATWSLVVKRNDVLGTVYLAMAFDGNMVYVGQDYPNKSCQIHRFYDDGTANQFDPVVVYSPPSDGYMPFISGLSFANMLIFANSAEAVNGVSRVVSSTNGSTWNVIKSQALSYTVDNRWNFLTTHPRKGIVFGTIRNGETYQIKDVTPLPSPTIQPTPNYTPMPTPHPTPTLTPKPRPSPSPSPPTPTASPIPILTPTKQPATPSPTSTQAVGSTFKIDSYFAGVIAAVVIMGGTLLTTALMKRKHKK